MGILYSGRATPGLFSKLRKIDVRRLYPAMHSLHDCHGVNDGLHRRRDIQHFAGMAKLEREGSADETRCI